MGEVKNGIVTKNLKVGYDGHIIVPNFDIEIRAGKITSIIGANGCGKSTVLKAIGRIIRSESGCIMINDRNIADMKNKEIAQQMAILPQSPTAPGTLTCNELVAYGRFPYQKGFGKLSKEDKEIVEWSLSVTNMTDFSNRPIASLSGGQRQRVWIAMALAQQTGIILLDEPTTYLDMSYQLEVLEVLQKLNKEKRITVVIVLHELNNACRFADNIIGLKKGKVICEGRPMEVITKETLKEIYGIDANLQRSENGEYPVCMEYELFREGA